MTDKEGPDPLDVAVGARIRLRRQELGMSQQELGRQLGVTFQQVQKYERGANRISASTLVRTARALRCPGAHLLGWSPEEDASAQGQDDALQAEINALLAVPGALELLRAYAEVPSGESRSALLSVVKGLAASTRLRACGG